MPRVFLPPAIRSLADQHECVEAEGATVRQVIDSIEADFPGVRARLCDENGLHAGVTVVVDGSVASLGLIQPVLEDSEIHFLPAVGGG